ncbi:ABC transporter permease [Flexibacterium corallicola]|uniref:ABC transporter permease n=1 Tax=Flexibacterium corallicola TaxID=3037259 RepID=UPI00286FABD5|nr:ABC transporter permease [Pseudovibrio sp. M1P-2-3]
MLKKSLLSLLRGAGGLAVFILLWEFIVWFFELPRYMLPGPFAVWDALITQWSYLLYHASITAGETLLGFVFGTLAGIYLALLLSWSSLIRRLLLPSITASQSFPAFAIAPLLVLWFGFGLASKVIMAVFVIFFSITSTFYDGLRRTDTALLDLGHLYRLNRRQMLWYIRIPAALPALSSGLRIAAVFAPIGAIVGEWVGAKGGLAFIMLQANARMQTPTMFAALILLAAMVLILRALVEYATSKMVYWQQEQ